MGPKWDLCKLKGQADELGEQIYSPGSLISICWSALALLIGFIVDIGHGEANGEASE